MNQVLQHLRKRVLPASLSLAMLVTGFGGAVVPLQATARPVAPAWAQPAMANSGVVVTPALAKSMAAAQSSSSFSSSNTPTAIKRGQIAR